MKTFLTFYFLCCCTLNVFAQEIGFPIIRNYTPKEYNGQPQIFSVLQDKNTGILYFGTPEIGIISYDGVKWREILTPNRSSAKSMTQHNHKIYIAVTDNFGYLTTNKDGKTTYQSLTHLITDTTLKIGAVWSVKNTTDRVYFQSNETVFEYLPLANKLNLIKADTNGTFRGDFVYRNQYYVRLSKKGLMKIEQGKLVPAPQAEFFKDKNAFRTAIPYSSTTLLMPRSNENFFLYSPQKDSVPTVFNLTSQDFLLDNDIYTAYTANPNHFLIGSYKKGVLLFDKKGKTLQIFSERNSLQINDIITILQDTTKNIWLGLGNGISKTEHSQDLSYWNKTSGIKGNVLAITRYDNTIYIATNQKVYWLDTNNQPQEIKEIPVGQNWTFLEFITPDNTKKLLVGTAFGIYEIQKDKAVQLYKGGHAVLSYKININRFYATDNDYFTSCFFRNNIFQMEGKWAGIKDDIRGITEDNNGVIWLGTYSNGIIRVIPDKDSITKPKQVKSYKEAEGLPSLNGCKPFWFKGKLIWGTEKGLYSHNPQTDKFEPFCELGKQFCDGSRSVARFQELPNGRIYIAPSSNKKEDIGYLKPNGKGGYDWVYQPFRRLPEIASIECMYIEENGVFWLGGSEGLFRYDESKDTKDYQQKFNCLIREVRIGKDSIIYYGGGSPTPALPKGEGENGEKDESFPIPLGEGAKEPITYQYNNVKFEFAAPFFDNEERTLYRFKLEGNDENWSEWSRQTEKEYTNLWEGTYTFKAQAKNIYDVESEIATYTITILPPWYRTWWAYTIYSILSMLAIYGLIKWNTRRLELEKIRLEEIVKARTAEIMQQKEEIQAQSEVLLIANLEISQQKEEIEVQAENLQEANMQISLQHERITAAYSKLKDLENFKEALTGMIVHDLKNPLNTILGFAEQELNSATLKNITQAGKQMLAMVMNILDIQKFENAAIQLVVTPHFLLEVTQTAITNTHLLAEEKRLQVVVSIPPTVVVETEFDILLRILENLLTNAIKYTPMRGLIEVGCEVLAATSMVKVFVKDTGQGIPADKIQSVFDKFSQVEAKKLGKTSSTGLGLTFCKMAVEAHGGQIGVESTVGVGTAFWFTLTGHVTTQTTTTVANHSQPTPIQWTAEELAVLQDLKKALQSFEIYESGAIFSVLNQHKAQIQSPTILAWIEELQAVVFNFEEQLFKEMISI